MARRPQRSTGRALIGGGVGLIAFALLLWSMPSAGGPERASPTASTLVAMLLTIVGVPIGIGGIIVGILRIRRGER